MHWAMSLRPDLGIDSRPMTDGKGVGTRHVSVLVEFSHCQWLQIAPDVGWKQAIPRINSTSPDFLQEFSETPGIFPICFWVLACFGHFFTSESTTKCVASRLFRWPLRWLRRWRRRNWRRCSNFFGMLSQTNGHITRIKLWFMDMWMVYGGYIC